MKVMNQASCLKMKWCRCTPQWRGFTLQSISRGTNTILEATKTGNQRLS